MPVSTHVHDDRDEELMRQIEATNLYNNQKPSDQPYSLRKNVSIPKRVTNLFSDGKRPMQSIINQPVKDIYNNTSLFFNQQEDVKPYHDTSPKMASHMLTFDSIRKPRDVSRQSSKRSGMGMRLSRKSSQP
jgi:hypothetical protein